MAQYVYTMQGVTKVVPPQRTILQNINLSFFPGAKIGVLGLNGSGKSSLLRIMAGQDSEIDGEARAQKDIRVGYLPQEPALNDDLDVRGNVELGVAEVAFVQGIELLVVRHDQMGVAGNLARRRVAAPGLEHVHLADQHSGIDDYAIADYRRDVVVEHSARDVL